MFTPEDRDPYLRALVLFMVGALLAVIIMGTFLTLHILNIIYLSHIRP